MQVECYDIEVVTGSQAGAGTTASVYLELCGEGGASGEHRLMYREAAGRAAFAAGATDAFKLHCCPLGNLLKVRSGWVGKVGEAKGVWHGLCKFVPGLLGHAWFCMEHSPPPQCAARTPHSDAAMLPHLLLLQVRVFHNNAGPSPDWFLQEVRVRPAGAHSWTVFPCARWLAVHQDDG
jgi:hypothetical protein